MRIDCPSSVRLAAVLMVMTFASSSSTAADFDTFFDLINDDNNAFTIDNHNDISLPLPIQPLIQQLQRPHRRAAAQPQAQAQPQAWIDYYSSLGNYISEDTLVSGRCHTLPSTWGILDILPFTRPNPAFAERDQLVLFNDPHCITVNKEPATKTGYVLIAMYFNKVPQSVQWTRFSSDPSPQPPPVTTTTSRTPAASTSSQPTTAASSSLPTTLLPSSSSSSQSTLLTPAPPLGVPPQPTPNHSTFPLALIPPKPLPDSSSSSAWGDNCGGPENDPNSPGCKGAQKVKHFLIVGITVAVIAVSFMAAGSLYMYRKFYTQPLSTTQGSSTYPSNHHTNNYSSGINTNSNSNSNSQGASASRSGTASGTGRRLGDDADPEYEYVHDDDGTSPPRFMFNHRHDNINTHRNPRLFHEASSAPAPVGGASDHPYPNNASDISLIERVRK
ncbi:hypothetical protein BGX29_011949 [Mortierella sp. GBA35]|nr:hypothetical protein BGX29_011949 [Mortierella sp. GBA35]